MAAWEAFGWFYENQVVAFMQMQLHEQVGKYVTGASGKKCPVFTGPRGKHIPVLLWCAVKVEAWPIGEGMLHAYAGVRVTLLDIVAF